MLRSLRQITGFDVQASDGALGSVDDVLFDDQRWIVRYLVAKNRGLASGRRELCTPPAVHDIDFDARVVHLRFSREQLEAAPDLDHDLPVSRQLQRGRHLYFAYPFAGNFGFTGALPLLVPGSESAPERPDPGTDPHLRSLTEVVGYQLLATDHGAGRLTDMVLDESTWQVAFLVVATRSWGLGRDVLVPPEWIERVSFDERKLHVKLSRLAVQSAPAWRGEPIAPGYASLLLEHYGRQPYWFAETRPGARRAGTRH